MSGRAILVACLLVVAGCGSGGGGGDGRPPTPADAVHGAAEAARGDALRVRVTRSGTVEGLGVYGFKGEAIVRGGDASARGLVDGPKEQLPFEVRVRGDDAWITKGPEKVPRGVRWIEVPGDRSIERGFAPYFLVDAFAKARDVERVGEAQVDGAAATHYRALVPVSDLRHVPEIRFMGGSAQGVPVDLYVAGGRPKRLRLKYGTGESDMFADLVVLGVSAGEPAGPPPAAQTVAHAEVEE